MAPQALAPPPLALCAPFKAKGEGEGEGATAPAAGPAPDIAPPPRASPTALAFRNLSARYQPTNYAMLLFRTANRDAARPWANADHVAPLFR